MARTSQLEEQLSVATRRFVSEVVTIIRGASFSDVAGFDPNRLSSGPAPAATIAAASALHIGRGRRAAGSTAKPPSAATAGSAARRSSPTVKEPVTRRPRQTAEKRAEIAEKILAALQAAGTPVGVRTLASELHVSTDLLNAPLLELRTAGKITKHGEKRATTYALS